MVVSAALVLLVILEMDTVANKTMSMNATWALITAHQMPFVPTPKLDTTVLVPMAGAEMV
jgi:hypothetical protein